MNTDLMIVKTTPVKIEFDFDTVESYIKKELDKYDVVVTLETLPGGKELAKELNKTAGEIDKIRKEKIGEASEPIRLFDAQMKSLVVMCKSGRVKILEQIKVFEDETRKKVEILLTDYRAELWRNLEVKEEFLFAEFDDLIIISNMTKAGSLAGKAKSELEKRVNADLLKQNMVETRLLLLENASYKAGLLAPLTRTHVRFFMFAEDDVYNARLDEIIKSEVERQEVAAEAVRKRTLKESQQDAPAVKETHVVEPEAELEPEPAYIKPAAPVGQTMHVIQATFEVPVPDNIDVIRVVDKLKSVMKKAGITTLKEIKAIA